MEDRGISESSSTQKLKGPNLESAFLSVSHACMRLSRPTLTNTTTLLLYVFRPLGVVPFWSVEQGFWHTKIILW
jgi:hypothetical protein